MKKDTNKQISYETAYWLAAFSGIGSLALAVLIPYLIAVFVGA